MKFMLGQKLKMTQVFNDAGRVIPATLLAVGPITVTQVKTAERDGYASIQLGLAGKKKTIKREYRLGGGEADPGLKLGDQLTASVFAAGDSVAVSGISKGKGFQGVVKRHGFHGGARSHGQKHSEREPGAIGGGGGRAGGRVAKGMRMGGRMGGERVTVKNLKVVAVDAENHQLLISGAIPGRRGTLLEIRG